MGDDEIKQIIRRELSNALGADGGTLSIERQQAQEYYQGEKFGNEVAGRSQVVMRSVLEAVEWVLPALLRIFAASDKIANVEPTKEGKEEEQAATQATDYLSHIFYKDNDGFLLLHDWFKDALLEKLGWVKYWFDTQKIQETNTYNNLTKEQYDATLGKDPDAEVVYEREHLQDADEFNQDRAVPASEPIMLYDCKIRVTREQGRIKIENVPPEEVLFSRHAKRGVPIPFLSHRRQWTYSDLIEQGYDAASLDEVPSDDTAQWNSERVARHVEEEDMPPDDRTDALRPIWVEESYVRLDRDGNGTAELCKVVTAANGLVILTKDGESDIEEVDEVPFVSVCPIPMPHKLVGMSLADLVMDLQLIKSTLVRQMLDNIYLTNNPRTEVPDTIVNENTYDDLLTSRPGGLIRTKAPGGLQQFTTPFVADAAFPIVEYMDQTQEIRTGVSRHNQGLNPDDLNKTATGVNLIQQAAAQRVELIARIFATGVQELVRGILGLVRRHQQQERIIKLTGKWLTMDPREWRNEMDVSVSVGLGTGNRDQILMHLQQILQYQEGIVVQQKGLNGPLVYAKNVWDVLEKMTENAGFKESFFTDPSQPPPQGMPGQGQQPPQPDPETMKAQAQIAAAQAKAQADSQIAAQKAQAEAQIAGQKVQHEMQHDQQKAALEMELKGREMQHRMDLEQQDAANRFQLEQQRMLFEMEMERQREASRSALAEREFQASMEREARRPANGDAR